MIQRILCISGGHGEDNHACHIIRRLRAMDDSLEFGAIPIVGVGREYQKLDVPIVSPTKQMPSGGFVYMDKNMLKADLRAGLIGLALRQLQALYRSAPKYDAVLAVGDHVPQFSAYLSGRPYVSFISCLTSLHTGTFESNWLLRKAFASERCHAILTRDPPTAEILRREGWEKARFRGMPAIDFLEPEGIDLALRGGAATVALLPGSRPEEGVRNFAILMRFARTAAARLGTSVQFCAALVPRVRAGVPDLAKAQGWQWDGQRLSSTEAGREIEIVCPEDAFADIAHACDVAIGLAGLALEQIVALGKPVIQFPGEGPQFTYHFARRQEAVLGLSAKTVGNTPPDAQGLEEGARVLGEVLSDGNYLAACRENAERRFSARGASHRHATAVMEALNRPRRS